MRSHINKNELESAVDTLSQQFQGPNDPTREQYKALLNGNLEGPFNFINLLCFKELATYPVGHAMANENISGADAYDKYGAVALEQVIKRGGRLMVFNQIELTLVGQQQWHQLAIMEYKNINAFIEMLSDPEYMEAAVHRHAGLADTQLIVSRPMIDKPIG